VKEYLTSTRILGGRSPNFAIVEKSAHKFAVRLCLIYLLHFDSPSSLYEGVHEDYPSLRYAAQFWPQHFHDSFSEEGDTVEYELMKKLFDPRPSIRVAFTNWLRIYDADYPGSGYIGRRNFIGFDDRTNFSHPLYFSSLLGFHQLTLWLLQGGASVNQDNEEGVQRTALAAAACNGHESIVRLLLAEGAEVNTAEGKYGTALHIAALHGHENVVRLLLSNGAIINKSIGIYGTALQCAAFPGHEEIVQLLLDRGAEVNGPPTGHFGTALQAGAFRGHLNVVKNLLAHNADVNSVGGCYGTALQAVSFGGYPQGAAVDSVVSLLLDSGTDINAVTGAFGTALQGAAAAGNVSVVQLLLARGADVNAIGGRYGTALKAASERRNGDIVRMLLEKGARIPEGMDI